MRMHTAVSVRWITVLPFYSFGTDHDGSASYMVGSLAG
jgi:hypothetical protein